MTHSLRKRKSRRNHRLVKKHAIGGHPCCIAHWHNTSKHQRRRGLPANRFYLFTTLLQLPLKEECVVELLVTRVYIAHKNEKGKKIKTPVKFSINGQ